MPARKGLAADDLVDGLFDAIFVAVENAPMQHLFGRHTFSGIVLVFFFHRDVFIEFNDALQRIRPFVEDEVFHEAALLLRDFCVGFDL